MRSRVEDATTDTVSSRLYLNPRYDIILAVYEEIFHEAEIAGLRFRAKVFDPNLRKCADEEGRVDEKKLAGFIQHYADKRNLRTDPIIFYGFEEPSDQLMQIVNKVYKQHSEAFAGRPIPAIPVRVSDGYAVGEEPIKCGGEESLTSDRENVFRELLQEVKQNVPEWNAMSRADRQKLFSSLFRQRVGLHHIDPENIAFATV